MWELQARLRNTGSSGQSLPAPGALGRPVAVSDPGSRARARCCPSRRAGPRGHERSAVTMASPSRSRRPLGAAGLAPCPRKRLPARKQLWYPGRFSACHSFAFRELKQPPACALPDRDSVQSGALRCCRLLQHTDTEREMIVVLYERSRKCFSRSQGTEFPAAALPG